MMTKKTKSVQKKSTRYPGVRLHGKVLYIRVKLANGKWTDIRYGQGTPKDASVALAKRQERENRIRAGVEDPKQSQIEQESIKTVKEHLQEYIESLRLKGRDNGHVRNMESFILEGIRECRVKKLIDFKPEIVNRWISELSLAARSKIGRRKAIVAFCNWAYDFNKIMRNPCPSAQLVHYSEDDDRSRLSRAMTVGEFERLLQALDFSREARIRRVFYLVAGNLGLRWREVTRLRWENIDFDKHAVWVSAGQTKSKKPADLPLSDTVAEALTGIRPFDAQPMDKIFSSEPRLKTWKRDLQQAGIIDEKDNGYVDDRGRRLDRKCLRMSFCTWLHAAGVPLQEAQELMRHSDVNLTSKTYNDVRVVRTHRNTLESIAPKLKSPKETQRAAG